MNNKSCKKARVAPGPASDMHPADVKCALEKAGWSLRQLSKKHNLSPSAFAKALVTRVPRLQKIIADELGINPWDIWPSRYDAQNNPIKFKRGRKPKNYSTESRHQGQGAAS
ncbi:hypothetical protein AKK86_02525 [Idiomarina sp. FenBw--71]|nr:hypothetical protein [Idiomarina sp. FeN1]NCU56329.1 hypothetical protein [Idiomarina sp. FenA--70]NCU59348.1 hypothetical protein [Idiomarina sp. FenBw--71]